MESWGWCGNPTVGGVVVCAQETSAMLLNAKLRFGVLRGLRRGVVLFAVLMLRQACVILSMLGNPCRCSVRWRHCSTVAARSVSMFVRRRSVPTIGVLPYRSIHLSSRSPSPIMCIPESNVEVRSCRILSCLIIGTMHRYLPSVSLSFVVSMEQIPRSSRLWWRHQLSSEPMSAST